VPAAPEEDATPAPAAATIANQAYSALFVPAAPEEDVAAAPAGDDAAPPPVEPDAWRSSLLDDGAVASAVAEASVNAFEAGPRGPRREGSVRVSGGAAFDEDA
jgi:hypothetical protein